MLYIHCTRQVTALPLIALAIIIIHPIINYCFYLSLFSTFTNINFILHITKKTFLWCIIPTIAFMTLLYNISIQIVNQFYYYSLHFHKSEACNFALAAWFAARTMPLFRKQTLKCAELLHSFYGSAAFFTSIPANASPPMHFCLMCINIC